MGTRAALRALARDPDSAGLPDGIEVVRGDLSDPGTLEACLDGVDAVFLVWPFLTAEAAPAVLEVAAEHVRRIVYLSSMGVRDDLEEQADPINRFHADLERLIEKSGLEWTFLRSHTFATNALWWAPQIRADGVVREPYGAAARPVIHERDIAAVAARVLTSDGHGGATYRPTRSRLLKLCVVEIVLLVEFCHGKLPVLVTLANLDVRLDRCPIEHCFNQGSQELVGPQIRRCHIVTDSDSIEGATFSVDSGRPFIPLGDYHARRVIDVHLGAQLSQHVNRRFETAGLCEDRRAKHEQKPDRGEWKPSAKVLRVAVGLLETILQVVAERRDHGFRRHHQLGTT